MNQANFTLKLLLPIAFVLLSIGQLAAWMNPANGMEISIYTSTPVLFWVSLIFALLLGLLIITRHLTKADLQKHVLVSGILLLAYASLSFISLFIVRGYYIYILLTGDVGYHYGVVDKILLTGFESVHYPLLHIQTAISQLFTGIPMDNMINITTVVFTVVLIIGINLLIRQITGNRYVRYMSYFVSLLVPFGCSMFTTGNWSFSMFIPFLAGFCITPYIIYCIFQLSESQKKVLHLVMYTILLNILLLAALFFHPVIYVVCFAFLGVSAIFLSLRSKGNFHNIVRKAIPFVVTIGVTLGMFLVWTLVVMKSGSNIVNRIFIFMDEIISHIIPKNITPPVDSLAELPAPIPVVNFQAIPSVGEQTQHLVVSDTAIVDMMGNTFASEGLVGFLSSAISFLHDFGIFGVIDMGLRYAGLLVLFCLMLALFLPKVLLGISKPPNQKIFCMYLLATIAIIYTIASLIIDLSIQLGRIFPFVILSGIIVTGFILGILLENWQHAVTKILRKTSGVLFLCLILILTPMALGLYYPTMTESMHSSDQNTYALVSGNDFYLTHGNFTKNQEAIGLHYLRMVEAFYHSEPIFQKGKEITYYHIFKDTVPHHFGYDKHTHLNQSIIGDTYLSINENIATYNSVTPSAKYRTAQYTDIDFCHLEYDSSVQKYYSNPDMRLYIVV